MAGTGQQGHCLGQSLYQTSLGCVHPMFAWDSWICAYGFPISLCIALGSCSLQWEETKILACFCPDTITARSHLAWFQPC